MLDPSSLMYAPALVSSTCLGASTATSFAVLAIVTFLSAAIFVAPAWLCRLTLPLAACSAMPRSWFGSPPSPAFVPTVYRLTPLATLRAICPCAGRSTSWLATIAVCCPLTAITSFGVTKPMPMGALNCRCGSLYAVTLPWPPSVALMSPPPEPALLPDAAAPPSCFASSTSATCFSAAMAGSSPGAPSPLICAFCVCALWASEVASSSACFVCCCASRLAMNAPLAFGWA
ncbi:hypothetical protein D3C87_613070 [compost metagenome]